MNRIDTALIQGVVQCCILVRLQVQASPSLKEEWEHYLYDWNPERFDEEIELHPMLTNILSIYDMYCEYVADIYFREHPLYHLDDDSEQFLTNKKNLSDFLSEVFWLYLHRMYRATEGLAYIDLGKLHAVSL